MALGHKRGVSPLHRSRAASGAPTLPLGYALEWSSGPTQTRQHRHALSSAEELRTELLAGECRPGSGRMVVVRGRPAGEVAGVLRAVGDLDGEFLARHSEGRACRPGARARGWCWTYPEVDAAGSRDGRQDARICRASLWLASQVPVLLLGHHTPPSAGPRHQDAATSRLAGRYGAVGSASRPGRTGAEASSFEEDLWDALASVGGSGGVSVEETLGELVYGRWADFLAGLGLGPDRAQGPATSLWRAMAALERNLDEARALARQGRLLDAVGPTAWGDLLQRLHARMHLRPAAAPQQPRAPADAEAELINERSLNRIAYLGGVLLPVTVVAGVLSIEGDYGPAGARFWVFWVAGLAASLAALLVIYADELRSLEVWLEVDEDEDGGERQADGDGRVVRPAAARRWRDGRGGRTWRRGELGWAGAVKKMAGYYRWRGDPRVRFGRPGEAARARGA